MKPLKSTLQKAILVLLLIAASLNLFAQQNHYGDLSLVVFGYDDLLTKAIDPDLQDTTTAVTVNSIAYFEDLYIFTSVGIAEDIKNNTKSLSGNVRFYDLFGNLITEKQANIDGTVLFNGLNKTAMAGIYLLQDENSTSIKFIYLEEPCLLGKKKCFKENNNLKTLQDNSNIYEIWVDGRFVEWYPFDVTIEEHELFADIVNSVLFHPESVADGPATGQVEILVDGQAAGDNSQVKIVRTGQTDTLYLVTANGIAPFIESDGVTSHPFGNFTRNYTILINSYDADSNWFHAESNEVEIALGAGNNFIFNPAPYTNAEQTANVTLSIILTNGMPATSNAEVKTYRVGETDTTFAYTNADGIAEFVRLLNPYYAEEHEISINSDLCNDTIFVAMTELHDLVVGQNDIEMNPDSMPAAFAEGVFRVWNENSPIPGVEVSIWRLNNTIDTVIYITNGAGYFYYENLPIEGDSSDYVFESTYITGTDLYTTIDTFSLIIGFNEEIEVHLQQVIEYNHAIGTVRDFYEQDILVSGLTMEIWESNFDTLYASCITNDTGYWHIDSIPLGFEAKIKMIGLTDYFNRTNDFNFPDDVIEPGGDSTSILNMLHVPQAWIIPQTENDPAPATVAVDPALINQLVSSDAKNAEEFIRGEKRMYLTNFSSSGMEYALAVEAAIDSLFYGGQGSSIVFVPDAINITSYHQNNYDPLVGYPNELGFNVTNGGGNNTSLIGSTLETGGYILGGTIHITGSIESAIKEWVGRAEDMGDTDTPGMMYTGGGTYPNQTERAYHSASNLNLTGRIVDGYEMFSLKGLTTTSSAPSKPAPIKPLVKDDSFIE